MKIKKNYGSCCAIALQNEYLRNFLFENAQYINNTEVIDEPMFLFCSDNLKEVLNYYFQMFETEQIIDDDGYEEALELLDMSDNYVYFFFY